MNKIGLYIRQAWTLLRQNKLYSGIYIAGTALSVGLAMILIIILYIKAAPLYPEYNRDRTFVIKTIRQTTRDTLNRNTRTARANYKWVELMRDMPHLEYISGIVPAREVQVETDKLKGSVKGTQLKVDDGYWNVFDFEFISGKPFSRDDIVSASSKVIVTSSFAKKIFNSDDAVGKTVLVDGVAKRVCAVVKDVARSMSEVTVADMWIPLNLNETIFGKSWMIGSCYIFMTVRNSGDEAALAEDVKAVFDKYNSQDKEFIYSIWDDRPFKQFEISFGLDENEAGMEKFWYILLALLLIPALNLSGLISSKMNDRLPEMGIRKVFGATNGSILSQVMWENLVLTLIGGLLGLALCYMIAVTAGDWFITLFDESGKNRSGVAADKLSLEMLFNWTVFGGMLILVFVLNLISGIVPALLSLRKNIVYSLNQKH